MHKHINTHLLFLQTYICLYDYDYYCETLTCLAAVETGSRFYFRACKAGVAEQQAHLLSLRLHYVTV